MNAQRDGGETKVPNRRWGWVNIVLLVWITFVGAQLAKTLIRMQLSPRYAGPGAPVVLIVRWPSDGDVGLAITGALMTTSSAEPPEKRTSAVLSVIDGPLEGRRAAGYAVLVSTGGGPRREVYRFFQTTVQEDGRTVLVIEGRSQVVWRIEPAEGQHQPVVAREGEQVLPLPLDRQPGAFHIRIELFDPNAPK